MGQPKSYSTSINHEIDALLDLISTSTREAVAEYVKSGAGVPSVNAVNAHPLDEALDGLALKRAIRTLEGACERLCTTLAQPMHTMRSMPQEAPCMRFAIENRIADILESFPNGLHVDEIVSKTENKINPRKLGRIMRLLATRGCFREVSDSAFANNRLSLTLLSSNPVSSTILLDTYECLKGANALPESMAIPEYAESETPNKSAFTYAVRDENINGGLFEWYKRHPEIGARFDQAMVGWTRTTAAISMVKGYPWDKLPTGTTVCDIGSGVGAITLALAQGHPHLRITLQDLPDPLEQARQVWSSNYPQAIEESRISFVTMNFLVESPVPEQDIYYMKHIMHDWPDAEAMMILKNIAKVMKPSSRVFVHDIVMKHVYTKEEEGTSANVAMERAPAPLLPNYGTGSIRNYHQDINMLAMFNAQERTCEEFIQLGAESGLELVKVWDFAETFMLEFSLQGSAGDK
ncbi:hypothetical protein VKT23_011729 [Stygiomarasmius scandens]|uniref:S-adenosyl-L-methionine-dependent methyltransferase n=1 Tax=Marasmiellus scandens TaxID=2682957 RepID=A0ABR1JAG2_9AGAR